MILNHELNNTFIVLENKYFFKFQDAFQILALKEISIHFRCIDWNLTSGTENMANPSSGVGKRIFHNNHIFQGCDSVNIIIYFRKNYNDYFIHYIT